MGDGKERRNGGKFLYDNWVFFLFAIFSFSVFTVGNTVS